MFGGLAFLLHGHMAVAASRRGGVLVRVNAAESADLVAASGVERMVMGGREMENWLYVDPAGPNAARPGAVGGARPGCRGDARPEIDHPATPPP